MAETAGLRLRPGSPRAVFDQDVWDLTGLADAPVVMSTHRKILDFTGIANPRWRQVAREYLLARLAPRQPTVATLAHAFRTPLNPHSLWSELKHLTGWCNHLTSVGVASLTEVDQRHCDTYLARASRSATVPDRLLSPATTVAMVRTPKHLTLYGGILSDRYRPGSPAAAPTRSPATSAPPRTGYRRCRTRCSDRLLADNLYLLNTIGPHLVAEAATKRTADAHEAQSRRGLLISEIDDLRARRRDGRATSLINWCPSSKDVGCLLYLSGPTAREG